MFAGWSVSLRSKRYVFITLCFVGLSCSAEPTLDRRDVHLKLGQAGWLFENKPFTGTLIERLPDATRTTHFAVGLEDGEQILNSLSGEIIEKRFYRAGKKNGIHRGWFKDGKDRFYSEFVDDHYVGDFWTWHPNGKVAEYKKFTPQGDILVYKHWRESGQIYSNQVFAAAQNEATGMPGVKLCNSVEETLAR